MTTETTNLLIGGAFGILSSVIINYFSFKREREYGHKNKVRYLLEALRKASGQCKYQTQIIKGIVNKIESDLHDLPMLGVSAYPAIDILAETVIKEDYYNSYMHLYKPIINPNDKFFELEYESVFLSGQLKMIKDLVEQARKSHNQRQHDMIQKFTDIRDEIETTILRRQDLTPEEQFLKNNIIQIFENFKKKRKSYSDTKELYDLAIYPLLILDKKNALSPSIAINLDRAFQIFHDIEFQNRIFLQHLKELHTPFESATKTLIELNTFFNSNMIKQFKP